MSNSITQADLDLIRKHSFTDVTYENTDIIVNFKVSPYAFITLQGENRIFNLTITNTADGDNGKILFLQTGQKQLTFSDNIKGHIDLPQNNGSLIMISYNTIGQNLYLTNSLVIGDTLFENPAPINDLIYTYLDNQSCQIKWTSQKGNQFNSSASFYDIRYSNSNIENINNLAIWNSLVQIKNDIVPQSPGNNEIFTITKLPANTDFYLYIKAVKINEGIKYYSDISNVLTFKTKGILDLSKAYQLSLTETNIIPQKDEYAFNEDLNRNSKISDMTDEQSITQFKNDGYPDSTIKNYKTYWKPKPYQRTDMDYTIYFDFFKTIEINAIYLYAPAKIVFSVYGISSFIDEWEFLGTINVTFNDWGHLNFEYRKFRYIKFVFDGEPLVIANPNENGEGMLADMYNSKLGKIANLMFFGKPNEKYPQTYKPVKRRFTAKPTVDQFFCTNGHLYQQGRIHSLCSGEKVRLYTPLWMFFKYNQETLPYNSIKNAFFNISDNSWVIYNNGTHENVEQLLKHTYKQYGLKPYFAFTGLPTLLRYEADNEWNRWLDCYWLPNSWRAAPSTIDGFTKYNKVTFDPQSYKTISKLLYALATKYGKENTNDTANLFYHEADNTNIGLDLISGIEVQNEPNATWNTWRGYERPEEYAAILSAATDGNCGTLTDEDNNSTKFGQKSFDSGLLSISPGLAGDDANYYRQALIQSQLIRNDHKYPADVINVHKYFSITGDQHTDSDELTHTYAIPTEFSNNDADVEFRDSYLPNKQIWVTEIGYGESGSRTGKCGYQCFSLKGKYIGSWLIPDRHRSDVKGSYIIRSAFYLMNKGYDLMNYYSTECESNFFRDDQWGKGAGFEMFHWNDEPSNEPGMKYNAIEQYECKYDRGSFASMGLFGQIIENGGYPISRAYWYVATMRNRFKDYIILGTKDVGNPKIIVYSLKKKNENKGAYMIYYNDNKNNGVPNVTIPLPEGITNVNKINYFIPEIPNPEVIPNTLGNDKNRTGMPTSRHEIFTNGTWTTKTVTGSVTSEPAIYPENPTEGSEIVVLPSKIENPYFPIVGPVGAILSSNNFKLAANQFEEFDSASNTIKTAYDIKLSWRQVDAVCDYVQYSQDGIKGKSGTEENIDIYGEKLTVNVTEFPEFYFFDSVPTFDFNSIVTDLSITTDSYSALTLWWNNTNVNDTAYEIFSSSLPEANYTKIKTINAGVENKTTITNLTENTTYYFKIRPLNGQQKGTFSNYISGKTYSIIDRPTNIILSNENVNNVTISWTNKETISEFLYYQIYRKDNTDIYTLLNNIETPETKTYIDNTIVPGSSYSYKIRIVTSNGISEYSESVDITTSIPDPTPSTSIAAVSFMWLSIKDTYDEAYNINLMPIDKYHNATPLPIFDNNNIEIGNAYSLPNGYNNNCVDPLMLAYNNSLSDDGTSTALNSVREEELIGAVTGDNSFDYPDRYMEGSIFALFRYNKYRELKTKFVMNKASTYKIRIFCSTIGQSGGSYAIVQNSGTESEIITPFIQPDGYTATNNKSVWLEQTITNATEFNIESLQGDTSLSDYLIAPLNIVEIIKLT